MQLDISKWFNLGYLLDMRPTISSGAVTVLFIFFCALIAVALYLKFYQKSHKDSLYHNLLGKYAFLLTTMGVLGVIWIWLRYETAYFVSARFWLIVWVIIGAVWLQKILVYQYKTIPQMKIKDDQRQALQKYIPTKKRR